MRPLRGERTLTPALALGGERPTPSGQPEFRRAASPCAQDRRSGPGLHYRWWYGFGPLAAKGSLEPAARPFL